MRTGYPWWLRPFMQRDVLAITIGRRIYVSAEVGGSTLERLLRHEMVHVRQMQRLGVVRFLWRYLREYVAHRRAGLEAAAAYRSVSFEREAFAAEESEPV